MEQQQAGQNVVPTPNTKALLSKLEDARGLGIHSLESLNAQGETLDRIHVMNEEHTKVLGQAEWTRKRLSVRGRIASLFKKKPDSGIGNKSDKKQVVTIPTAQQATNGGLLYQQQPQTQVKEPPVEELLTEEDVIWHPEKKQQYLQQQQRLRQQQPQQQQQQQLQKSGSNPLYDDDLLAGMTPEQRQLLEEQDRDLDSMGGVLADLKQISLRTNSELRSQSVKIDNIHDQVDKNDYALRRTTILLGGK